MMRRLFFFAFLAVLCLCISMVLSCGKLGLKSKPTAPSNGIWKDSTSGLVWQVTPTGGEMTWSNATAHCKNLTLGGHGDWRLPTISELRSLIRGCPATQTGGACRVTDSCLNSKCWNDQCLTCSSKSDPGRGAAYWPPDLEVVVSWFWSSSPVTEGNNLAWGVAFDGGSVYNDDAGNAHGVRCVR